MEDKLTYFIRRTDADIKELKDDVKEGFRVLTEKVDVLTQWKIKTDTRATTIATIVTLVLNLVFIYFGKK